ncbi:hypothetical protein SprV_0301128900 [Sparganum proliferum]
MFSNIDMVRDFRQILIAPEDVSKTVVTTPFGLSEFLRMPFVLRNAPQTFQRFVDRVFRGLPFVVAHIDDLLVASSTFEEHMNHLVTVFDRLQQFDVVLNSSKCVFGVPPLEFLDHLVDSNGVHPLRLKVAAIRDFSTPSSKRQLQRFLGTGNFCRQFLPHCADTILPLMSPHSDPKRYFELSADALAVLDKMKAALADTPLLKHFSPYAPISLVVDASDFAVGAVLQQYLADCTRIRTTAYHPAANAIVERFHHQLKASLRSSDNPENWTDHLLLLLLGIGSSLESDIDCSAAELALGAAVRLPGQMISHTPRVAVEDPTNLLTVSANSCGHFSPSHLGHLSPSLTSRKTWRYALRYISEVIESADHWNHPTTALSKLSLKERRTE